MRSVGVILTLGAAILAGGADAVAQAPSGQGTIVSPLMIKPFEEAPIPKVGVGAPQFTAGEIAVIQDQARRTASDAASSVRQCAKTGMSGARAVTIAGMLAEAYRQERDAAQRVLTRAVAARAATEAAQTARREAASGPINADVVDTELARQAAVNALVAARDDLSDAAAAIPVMQKLIGELEPQLGQGDLDRLGWERTSVDKVLPLVEMFKQVRIGQRIKRSPSVFADLLIKDVVVREGDDGKSGFLAVSGKVVNTRPRAIRIPALEITQVDSFGFPLETVIADAQRQQVAPGAAAAFSYQFRPRSARAETVKVTFAATEPIPQRRSARAAIAPPLPPGPNSGAPRGMLAGDGNARIGVPLHGPADCSG